jgi:hypothetical protein
MCSNFTRQLCNIIGFDGILFQTLYSQIVKKSSATYRVITNTVTVVLLTAFLVPTGIQAKQLVTFCMMDMNPHASASVKTHSGHPEGGPASGTHCETQSESKRTSCDPCEFELICACGIGKSQLGDQQWIPAAKKFDVRLTRQNDLPPFYTSGLKPPADQQIRIGEYDPPLWLLYDTFLM